MHVLDIMLHMHHTSAMPDADFITAEITEHCLLTRTRQISRVVTSIYDQELRPFGINSPQFSLLVLISRLKSASRAEIGRANHQDRSTLTRNLQVILSEGWAEEVPGGTTGRIRPVRLTASGKDLLCRAATSWRMAQAQCAGVLGTLGVTAITEVASKL
jgi:DNA-binding MarR family transcriptional regulator